MSDKIRINGPATRAKIVARRKECGLTQEEMASRSGCSLDHWKFIEEAGEDVYGVPLSTWLREIADILDTTEAELLVFKGDKDIKVGPETL